MGVFLLERKRALYRAQSSPRPWGCFFPNDGEPVLRLVFPTPVGVFLKLVRSLLSSLGLPHARGGVSFQLFLKRLRKRSSPRPWGCFSPIRKVKGIAFVFPTPVGVFRRDRQGQSQTGSLPHARGGVSTSSGAIWNWRRSSPRPWGCFRLWHRETKEDYVFPTPVGVFPMARRKRRDEPSLPHARGGVSSNMLLLSLIL